MEQAGDKKRLIVYLIFVAIFILLILARLTYLMVIVPPQKTENILQTPEIERGPILDRNGKILAIQTKLNSVSASLPDIDNLKETTSLLASILALEEREITDKLGKQTQFTWIKRKISQEESDAIMELIKNGKLKGINLEPESARTYPKQKLASQIIGIAGIDNIGLEGIEAAFNDELYPKAGSTGNSNNSTDKIYGNQVFLSIDINLQYYLQEFATKAYTENKADYVMIMVMNAKTGEILGSGSIPDFNPNAYNNYELDYRNNRPVLAAYEPGSVFKIFSLAAFLELGGITEQDTFVCNGFYETGAEPINCLSVHGIVDAQKIIQLSCNVGAAYASERVSAADFYKVLSDFGFGKTTGIPLPGESAGILRPPASWSGRTKPTIAFGQEISVSAIQVMAAATVLTNEGVLLKPIIVDKIVSPTGKLLKKYSREPVRRVISRSSAEKMLRMMETATLGDGTARRAFIEGIRISAKTGTGQVINPETGKYSPDHFLASFLGIFPTNDPEVIVYVVIDHPKGELYHGSRIAAPVFKELAEKLITLLDLPGTTGTTIYHSGAMTVVKPGAVEIGEVMPDLKGVPKRLLLPLFRRTDLSLLIQGEGYVIHQDPAPGTKIEAGMKISLELE